MKKLFFAVLGSALVLSSGLAQGAMINQTNEITLQSGLLGKNTAENIYLNDTAKELAASLDAGDLAKARTQLGCLNALMGTGKAVAKTEISVVKGWFSNNTTETKYLVNGRNSLENNVDVETTLLSLGFAKYEDIVKTDMNAKKVYLSSYLTVMNQIMDERRASISMVQAFHKEFKTNFTRLTSTDSSKTTVKEIVAEAQAVAVSAVSNVVLPEVVESWFGFGTKSKVTLVGSAILIALAASKRTI